MTETETTACTGCRVCTAPAPETVTGAEADALEVGSVVLDPKAPAPLPIVKRPDGWASALYLDVHGLGRRHRYVVIRRAPAPTAAQLEAIEAASAGRLAGATDGELVETPEELERRATIGTRIVDLDGDRAQRVRPDAWGDAWDSPRYVCQHPADFFSFPVTVTRWGGAA